MIITNTLIFYSLLATSHCLVADSKPTYRFITKPMLMPLLAGYYWLAGGDQPWVYTALLGAWLGDIALLRFSKGAFIAGLVSFLFGHLAMAMAVYSLIPVGASIPWTSIIAIKMGLAMIAFGYLRPHLGSLQVAVFIYCLVLATKGAMALALYLATDTTAGAMAAAGALIFMLSDLLLAINRFAQPVPKAHLWVMSTYTLAQALMVNAMLQLS